MNGITNFLSNLFGGPQAAPARGQAAPQGAPAPTQSQAAANSHNPVGTNLAQVSQTQCPPELTAKANLLDRVVEFLRSKIDFLPKAIIDSLASLGLNLVPQQQAPAQAQQPSANEIEKMLAALSQPVHAGAGVQPNGQAQGGDEMQQLMQMLGASQQNVQAPNAPAGTSTQADASMGDLSKMLEQLEKQLGALEAGQGQQGPVAGKDILKFPAPQVAAQPARKVA